MKVMVLYDITENNVRNVVVNTLEEFGFYRLQKSVFIGNLKENIYKSFLAYVGRHVGGENKVYIVPMTDNSYKNIQTLGESKKYVLGILRKNQFEIK